MSKYFSFLLPQSGSLDLSLNFHTAEKRPIVNADLFGINLFKDFFLVLFNIILKYFFVKLEYENKFPRK